MLTIALRILALSFNVIALFAHFIGTFALLYLYKRSRNRTQRIYLINISLAEGMINLFSIISFASGSVPATSPSYDVMMAVSRYSMVAIVTGFITVWFVSLILLTLDRVAKITMNVLYDNYVCEQKTKTIAITIWFVSMIQAVLVSMSVLYKGFDYENIWYVYIFPCYHILFIIVSTTTYASIYRKFYASHKNSKIFRENASSNSTSNTSTVTFSAQAIRRSTLTKMRRSFIFIPALLILSFIVFVMTPNLTFSITHFILKQPSQNLFLACVMFYSFGMAMDAIIYIFFLNNVKRFLSTLFKKTIFLNFDSCI